MTAKKTVPQWVSFLFGALWRSHSTTNIGTLQPLLVRAVLFFIGIAATLNLFALPFVPPTEVAIRVGISLAIFGTVMLVRLIEYRWSTHVASTALIIALWLVASYPVAIRGVHSAGYSAYLLLIVIAITLLGTRGGVLVTIANTLVGALAVYMEYNGWLYIPQLDPVLLWSAHLIFSVVIVAVVSMAYAMVDSALQQTHEREEQLNESNRRLRESATDLQASNELLTATLASIDHAVFVLEGPERIVRMCNAEAERIFGYRAEELIGRSIAMVHQDQKSYEAFVRDRAAYLAHNNSYRTKFTTYHRNGSQRFLDVTVTPLLHAMSLSAGEVSVVRDITEEHLKNEQLQASQANYRELFNSMREGFVLLKVITNENGQGIDYTVVEINPAFEELTGLRRENVIGKMVQQVLPFTDLAQLAHYLKIVESGQSLRKEEYIQSLNKYFDISAFCPMPGHLVATFHDITERYMSQRALEEERALLAQRVAERTAELTQTNVELAQAARHKDEFLASVSHELRTPLNAILGTTEAMLEEIYGPLNEAQSLKLHTIAESGRHLLDLINEVLDMAKIEAGQLTLEIDTIDVATICKASLLLTRQPADNKALNVHVQIAEDVGVIQADGRSLKQMLINLLGNAIKFTPTGGTIGLRVQRDDRQGIVRFAVWDTGIGIAPDQQERLFQPFVQVDSKLTRQYGGSGLGLALVRKMAQLHGGTVSLESMLGQGSEFTLTLPSQVQTVRLSPPEDRSPDPHDTDSTKHFHVGENFGNQSPEVASSTVSVLLLEDDEAFARTIAAYCADKGYRVCTVGQRGEAMRSVQDVYYHLILVNVHTQDGDGLEVIRSIRADSRCRFSPILALSAQGTATEKRICLHAGATAYLDKSLPLQNFFAQFDKLLEEELL